MIRNSSERLARHWVKIEWLKLVIGNSIPPVFPSNLWFPSHMKLLNHFVLKTSVYKSKRIEPCRFNSKQKDLDLVWEPVFILRLGVDSWSRLPIFMNLIEVVVHMYIGRLTWLRIRYAFFASLHRSKLKLEHEIDIYTLFSWCT